MVKPIDIIRSGHIRRWSIVRVHRDQTIAEHMYQVAALCDMFASDIFEAKYTEEVRGRLLHNAITHDLPEVMFGDLPTPTKRKIDACGNQDEVNKLLDTSFWKERDESKRPKELPSEFDSILKLADLAEAILFLEIEGVDQRAKIVQDSILDSFLEVAEAAQRLHPEYNWMKVVKIVRHALNDLAEGRW